MTKESLVLNLICKALNSNIESPFLSDVSNEIWEDALIFATRQGVLAICFEAIEQLPANQRPPLELLMQWYGQTEQQKLQYEQIWVVARKLDKLWTAAGIHAAVLKGRAIAQYYPVPSHRYSCDLDVFIEKDWENACKLLEEKGIQLEHEVYKEVEFTLNDVYVECHRYITPIRGNKNLQEVERYLRSLLHSEPKVYFEGTTLACPPLMFTLMLYIEHALGDFLQGNLLMKHIVDWVILRKQDVKWETFNLRCKKYKFDRFVALINALADVVEGKLAYESLPSSYRDIFDEMFNKYSESSGHQSWFRRRLKQFFNIAKNGKKFRNYGYTSMTQFLFNITWAHFFDKEVKI
jgi:hypothetical protein